VAALLKCGKYANGVVEFRQYKESKLLAEINLNMIIDDWAKQKKILAFSEDGNKLVVAGKNRCIVLDVPIVDLQVCFSFIKGTKEYITTVIRSLNYICNVCLLISEDVKKIIITNALELRRISNNILVQNKINDKPIEQVSTKICYRVPSIMDKLNEAKQKDDKEQVQLLLNTIVNDKNDLNDLENLPYFLDWVKNFECNDLILKLFNRRYFFSNQSPEISKDIEKSIRIYDEILKDDFWGDKWFNDLLISYSKVADNQIFKWLVAQYPEKMKRFIKKNDREEIVQLDHNRIILCNASIEKAKVLGQARYKNLSDDAIKSEKWTTIAMVAQKICVAWWHSLSRFKQSIVSLSIMVPLVYFMKILCHKFIRRYVFIPVL